MFVTENLPFNYNKKLFSKKF